jgi:riboflavin kinase/FMN adenylyltransferase
MRVIRHLPRLRPRLERVVLTLGNFDGVHRGHQAILRRAVAEARARGGRAVALTFHPHPVAILAPARAPALIQSLRDRLATLAELGVDVAVVQRFTRGFAALEPEDFVTRFLVPSLAIAHVVVGYNVTFGHGRSGTAETLRQLGARHGFGVEAVGPVAIDGGAVSSSGVRRAVGAGDMARAAALLGRPLRLRGRVIAGERRGRTLGFPTANLHLRPSLLLPPDGVYAVRALVDGVAVPAVLNIGVGPTFGERRRTAEAHLLDWEGDLYGRWLEVAFVARLRPERRFAGPEALREAIARDVADARAALAAAAAADATS